MVDMPHGISPASSSRCEKGYCRFAIRLAQARDPDTCGKPGYSIEALSR